MVLARFRSLCFLGDFQISSGRNIKILSLNAQTTPTEPLQNDTFDLQTGWSGRPVPANSHAGILNIEALFRIH